MQFFEVEGTRLAYTEEGQGAPVLFVHGSLDDMRSWRLQMAPFGEHYRAIAYSRRYHYPNAFAADGPDYSAAVHAGDMAAVIEAVAAGPVHLVTSSYGGYVALHLAARRPELIRTLVLGEPPIMPWLLTMPAGAPLAEAFDRTAWLPARAALWAGDMAAGVAFFLDGVMGRPTFEYLPPAAQQMLLDNAPEMRAETASPEFFTPFSRADAATINLPVLLLDGALSPRYFFLISDELAQYLPQAQRAIIPNAYHAMHLGNPRVYNKVVLDFLAQHPI
jgi:non-heme chloroperoxidase